VNPSLGGWYFSICEPPERLPLFQFADLSF